MNEKLWSKVLLLIMTSSIVTSEEDYNMEINGGRFIRNCNDVYNHGYTTNGLYYVYFAGVYTQVYCEFEGPKSRDHWMVVQQRLDGHINFYRSYADYRKGFGDTREFWMGLDDLHVITMTGSYRLRIELMDHNMMKAVADYGKFSVGSPEEKFVLHVGEFLGGNAGDSLRYHDNCSFSTFDRDSDAWSGNCAVARHGGWWFDRCCYCHLNGRVFDDGRRDYAGILWFTWKRFSETMTSSKMKLQPNFPREVY